MIKIQSSSTIEPTLPKIFNQRSLHQIKRYDKDINTTLTPVSSTIDMHINRLHKWKKQIRTKKLQNIYDQNIRLFLSISKQKSVYQTQSKKPTQTRKANQSKLCALTQRSERYNR